MCYTAGMFINQLFSCQACGALWPQFGHGSSRVQLWKWTCSPACSVHYLAKAAGPIEDSGVPVTPAHIGTVGDNIGAGAGAAPHGLELTGALPPESVQVLHDYRAEIERAVSSFELNEFRGS